MRGRREHVAPDPRLKPRLSTGQNRLMVFKNQQDGFLRVPENPELTNAVLACSAAFEAGELLALENRYHEGSMVSSKAKAKLAKGIERFLKTW